MVDGPEDYDYGDWEPCLALAVLTGIFFTGVMGMYWLVSYLGP